MTTRRDSFTLDLFAAPPPGRTPTRHLAAEVSELVAEVLKQSPLDRYDIAAQMSRLSGEDVTKNMLDAWASPGRAEHNIPLYRGPLLEMVLKTNALGAWFAAKRGGQLLVGKDNLAAELGKLETLRDETTTQLNAEIKRIKASIVAYDTLEKRP